MADVKAEEVPVVEVEMTEPVVEELAPETEAEVKDAVREEVKEEVKDVEADEVECTDARYTDEIKLNAHDGTLNTLITGKNILSSINLDNLLLSASSRLNVGVNAGRYLFEVEVMQHTRTSEVRVGFSLANSSLFLGEKGSLAYCSNGQFVLDGQVQAQTAFRRRNINKGDVIGLLLNRTESGNEKTVSVFVNGVRHSSPQKIPESFDGALFPHVEVRGAVIAVNISKTPIRALPFTCRTIADASMDHITATAATEVSESEVIIPLGFSTKEWIETHISENPTDNFTLITQQFFNEWLDKSHLKRTAIHKEALESLHKLISLRKRKYIYAMGHNLLSEQRKVLAEKFSKTIKKTVVLTEGAIVSLATNVSFFKDVSVPTEEEGWDNIVFTNSAEKAKADLEAWQKRCKNQTKVADFKASDVVKEKVAEWEKFVAVTKKDAIRLKKEHDIALKLANGEDVPEEAGKPEEKKVEKKEGEEEKKKEVVTPSTVNTMDFVAEDWMLAKLRMELHTICTAFKNDVEDKERVSFSADFLSYYYKLYLPQSNGFNANTFGCKNVAEIVDLLDDTFKLESNMLLAIDEEASFDYFLQKTEDARSFREDRIAAGDEGAQLKFKASAQRKFGGKAPINRGPVNKGNFQNLNRGGKGPAAPKGGFHAGKGQQYSMRTTPAASGMKRYQPAGLPVSNAKRFR